MLMYQKSRFDHYYCIKTISRSKTLEKMHRFFFRVPILARKCTLSANVLKTPFPGQRLTSCLRHKITFAIVRVTDDVFSFCDCSGMLIYVKPQSRTLTARELPC